MTLMFNPATTDLIVRERDILARVASGGPLNEVLRDLVLLVQQQQPEGEEMLASVLFVSADGKRLLEGAAPSLPEEYNAAINGIEIGPGVGSCGTAAHCGEPIIVTDIAVDPLWQNFKDLALKHGLRACWSMPIKAADGSVVGTFANYYRQPKEPTDRDMEVISMVARTTGIAIERHRNELARQREEENRSLLVRELNHRVKNVFALASSLVALSARKATDTQELAKAVQDRFNALARAHDLVQPTERTAFPADATATFRQVLDHILGPYGDAEHNSRIAVAGTDVELSSRAITATALVLHELLTNAAKYGGLQQDNGTLSITWTTDDDFLHLVWDEKGFACSVPPEKGGFGSTLIRNTVERQFKGKIDYRWHSDGLTIHLDIPLDAISSGIAEK